MPGSTSTDVLGLWSDTLLLVQKNRATQWTSLHSFIYSSQIIMALLVAEDTKTKKAELFSLEDLQFSK